MKTSLPFALVLACGLWLFIGGLPGAIAGLVGLAAVLLLGRQSDIDARERAEEARFWAGRRS